MLVGVGAVFLDYETGTLNRSTSDSFVKKMLNVELLSYGKLIKGHCLVFRYTKAIDELKLIEAVVYHSVIGTVNKWFVEFFRQVEGDNVTLQSKAVNTAVDSSKLEGIGTSIFVLFIFRQVIIDICFRSWISTLLKKIAYNTWFWRSPNAVADIHVHLALLQEDLEASNVATGGRCVNWHHRRIISIWDLPILFGFLIGPLIFFRQRCNVWVHLQTCSNKASDHSLVTAEGSFVQHVPSVN
ncbi:unnamed protein product [Clonostachys rhizophaga]|uniref:Uncharacterized protein n=1 Tax=Clonostachys rhizophaga TaxID=160324 RepID=A0A9N9YW00_9HYPO|nr:unnamed protein product [Clonostachys rhizophaga]